MGLAEDPFTRCFERGRLLPNEMAYRLALAQRYAYVRAEPHLLSVVCRHGPLVEIGAGTGYWAWRLRLLGADVVAYDTAPCGHGENRYHPDMRQWTDVRVGDATVLRALGQSVEVTCNHWSPRTRIRGRRYMAARRAGQNQTGGALLAPTNYFAGRS